MRCLYSSPFTWLIILLVGAETALHYGFRMDLSGKLHRNPYRVRYWPEYLATLDDGRGSPDIVVVCNSQGFGREIADASQLYPTLLEQMLSCSSRPVRIENWSCPGLRTVDLLLLIREVRARNPRLVLINLVFDNFDPGLDMDQVTSDIHLLAGKVEYWPEFADSLLGRSTTPSGFLKRSLAMNTRLVRCKGIMQDRWITRLPRPYRSMIAGKAHLVAPQRHDVPGNLFAKRPADREAHLAAHARRAQHVISAVEMDARVRTLHSSFREVAQLLEAADIPTVFVLMPLAMTRYRPDVRQRILAFNREAMEVSRAHGVEAHDFTHALEESRFFTMGHFDEQGHRQIAEWLTPVVADALQ